MTTSVLPKRYLINGLLDTARPVMENMERITNASGSFLTYDIHEGKWGVVINKTGTSVKSFDDSNIIGAIQVNGTSLTNLYNSVVVEFPLRDTADQTDYVEISIPAIDRNANEPDNQLKITLDLCNEPVQAEIIGLIELKQSRIDQVITFQSDYSTLSLNAGDIIDVTNDLYQYTNKPFRVISLREIDDDAGAIRIEVTALEYDPDVYDISDLGRYVRSDRNGIKTIGAIGTPNTPQIYAFQLDRRPGIQVEAVVPSGIVESMELWLSTDGTNYYLLDIVYPDGGGAFDSGTTVLFDFDQVESNNYYAKVRGMNSTTTGPFSPVDSFLSFVPAQVADNIQQEAQLVDQTGNLITAFLLSELAAWAFARSPQIGNILGALGLPANTINTGTGASASVITEPTTFSYTAGNTTTALNAMAGNVSIYTSPGNVATVGYDSTTVTNNRMTIYGDYNYGGAMLQITVQTPTCTWDYDFIDYTGNTRTRVDLVAQPAMAIEIRYSASYGNSFSSATLIDGGTIDWNNNKNIYIIDDPQPGRYWVGATIIPTYDLDMYWPRSTTPGGAIAFTTEIFPYNFTTVSTDGLKASYVLYQ